MYWRIIATIFSVVFLSIAQQATISNFKDSSIKCDYLIITPAEFSSQAVTLANHRNNFTGDSVHFAKVAILEDILAQFHDTTTRTEMLHSAITWAYDNWSFTPLKYLVLIGDDSLSFNSSDSTWHSQGHMPSWVSTNQFDGNHLTVDSDFKYALLGNGTLADVAISDTALRFSVGRIPCESSEQLEKYINKLITYDTGANYGKWRNNVIAIADDCMQGAEEDPICRMLPHQTMSDSILNRGFQNRFVFKNYLSRYSPNIEYEKPDAREELIREINKNCFITIFTGHGASGVLADEHVLTADYCDSIKNNYPGIFISLTSGSGVFSDPLQRSIAKKMLFKSQGGFIGVIGSPGLTYASGNEAFGENLITTMSKNDNRTIGEVFNKTCALIHSSSNSYLILGDPALIIKHDTIDLSVSKNNDLLTLQSTANDSLHFFYTVTMPIHFTALSGNGLDFDYDSTVYSDSGTFLTSISKQFPPLNRNNLNVVVYVWDNNGREERVSVSANSITAIRKETKQIKTNAKFAFEKQSIVITSALNSVQTFQFSLIDLQGRTIFNKSGLLKDDVTRISFSENNLANRYCLWRLKIGKEEFTGRTLIRNSF